MNQRYSANRDEVDFSLFYPDTCVTRSGSNGSFYALPKANLLASLASFLECGMHSGLMAKPYTDDDTYIYVYMG